jgi:hypothetical protein
MQQFWQMRNAKLTELRFHAHAAEVRSSPRRGTHARLYSGAPPAQPPCGFRI